MFAQHSAAPVLDTGIPRRSLTSRVSSNRAGTVCARQAGTGVLGGSPQSPAHPRSRRRLRVPAALLGRGPRCYCASHCNEVPRPLKCLPWEF